jgi:uncharacterized membrane protein
MPPNRIEQITQTGDVLFICTRKAGLAKPLTGLRFTAKLPPALRQVSRSVLRLTLIGADLLNLDAVRGLGAPVASIGGAGTFDGIFLTGIMAVLLASFSRRA